jgi:hypothetical protein
MPSSTSNFELPRRREVGLGASYTLLALAALLVGGLELVSRAAVPRLSKIERRTEREYAAAVACGRERPAAKQALVLGNSLLNAGVQFERLQQLLRPGVNATRFVVEDTYVGDWYYGLRRLFAAGSRPDAVILMLNPRQLVSWKVRGDYSAYRLVQAAELPAAARDLDLSNTQATNLALAHFSTFFGLRSQIRNWVIGHIFPDFERLTYQIITHTTPPPLDEATVYAKSVERLRLLHELAAAHGSELVLVVPPSGPHEDPAWAAAVQRAGTVAGVRVLVPVQPGSLSEDYYKDPIHLNTSGAEIFTARLGAALRRCFSPSEPEA